MSRNSLLLGLFVALALGYKMNFEFNDQQKNVVERAKAKVPIIPENTPVQVSSVNSVGLQQKQGYDADTIVAAAPDITYTSSAKNEGPQHIGALHISAMDAARPGKVQHLGDDRIDASTPVD